MYKDFFGFDRNPFELSPDPSFMCTTEKSKAALASITYAITNRKGFVVMTGDAGTGKTLIVRSLFECWKSQGIAFANIFAPNLPLIDFLINATSDLGIKVAEPTKGNLLRAFYGFLVTQFQKGLTTVLVIDEAHQMPAAVLEEIRMLTNVETNQQKLVQVLLVGQPELDSKLDSFELRQLKQRIAIRCRLEPLTTQETNHYVACRLNLAGAKPQANAIFPTETIEAVHRYSRGIPRLINSVCEQALISACAFQIHVVPVEIIEEVASLFRLEPPHDPMHAEKPSSLAEQTEKSVPVETWQDLSSFNLPAMKAPDPNSSFRHVNAYNRTPAQTASPGNAETSNERSRADIPGTLRTEHGDSTSHNSTQNVYQGTNRAAAPSKARSLESTHASTEANESIFPKPTATPAKAGEPAIDQTPASVPMLRVSRFLYTAAVVALATAALLARRQNGAVIIARQVANTWKTFPVVHTTAPIQPAETNSAIKFNDGSVDRVAAQHGTGISKSTEPLESLLARTKTDIDTLSRPVLKSPDVSTFNEPPLILETQTNNLLDNGSFGISVPAPTPPAASTGENLQPPKLMSSPPLSASLLERTGKMQGVAVIDALIDDTGKVKDMKVISGFPRLTGVAMDALPTWKFEPAQLNGHPIPMRMKVSVNFRLH
jgi:type II secretory pathway predicted ATPase ExeA